jgi:hypothetical protein
MIDIKLADPQRHESLSVFPLIDEGERELPYELLSDAIEAGTLTIGEIGSGEVPELMVENSGKSEVLILDGEQLIGAKQNRMTNRSIVLAAGTKTRVPVSCMEHGRWRFETSSFSHRETHSPSKVRRHARKTEAQYAAAAMPASPQVLADAQGGVWDQIADYSAKMGGRSETGALDHLYVLKDTDLAKWREAIELVDGQVGLLAFLGDEPLGLDLISSQALYGRLHDRLASGYIMDALAAGRKNGSPRARLVDAQNFLDGVYAATRTEAPTVGRGTYRVLSGPVLGGELEDESRLVHQCAFPVQNDRVIESEAAPIRRRHWRV